LRHSCRSELRLDPLFPAGQTMPSSRVVPREPTYCPSRRFANLAVTRASPRRAQSLRGHTSEEAEGFPRHYPPAIASSLVRGSRVGLRRYEWVTRRSHLRGGQLFTRQGISLP
jgi:hypothetical protein